MKAILQKLFRPRPGAMIDDVATIRPTGRDTYAYAEGDHCITVYVEVLMGQPERRIHASSASKWMPPFDGEEITAAKRRMILDRLRRYFEGRGVSCERAGCGGGVCRPS